MIEVIEEQYIFSVQSQYSTTVKNEYIILRHDMNAAEQRTFRSVNHYKQEAIGP